MSRDELTKIVGGAIEPADIDVKHDPRACNADRKRTRYHLGECHELGYLTDRQYEARMLKATESETKKQLNHLISDLAALPDPRSTQVRRVLGTTGAIRTAHVLATVSLAAWTVGGSLWIFKEFARHIYVHGFPHLAHSATVDALFWTVLIFSVASTVASAIWWGVWESEEETRRKHARRGY